MRLPHGHGLAIDLHTHRRPGDRDHGIGMEAQGGATHGAFECRGIGGVAHQGVGHAVGISIHGAGRGHAHIPMAQATRPVLHGGLHASVEHLQRLGLITQRAQEAGDLLALIKHRVANDLPQVIEVGLNARHAGVIEGLLELDQRMCTVASGDDDLGQHGVVIGGHLGAALYPGVDTGIGGKHHFGQDPCAGLELPRRVFGIQADLNRRAFELGLQAGQGRQIAAGQQHHPGHQIDAADLFGHTMLDLQACVDLQEVEGAGLRVVHKLHRAGTAVVHRLGQAHRRGVQSGTLCV